MTEKRMKEIAAAGRAAARARFPKADDAHILTSFSAGDCYIDVRPDAGEPWQKFLFYPEGED